MEHYDTFNRVYDTTRDALLRWLVPRVRSSADVEDLMQDVYRKLYRQMVRRGGVREPEKYLFGIAKKELARFYRCKALVTVSEAPLSDALPDGEPTPEDWAVFRDRADEVWRIVQQEPLPSYQAFTLYYGFSVPTEQIASELGLSEDAVRRRLSRTRARIRQQLTD